MVESTPVEASELAHEIHLHFVTNGFEWNQGGTLFTPTPEQVEQGLQFMARRLDQEEDGTTLYGGRICMNKNGDHLDTYVYFGDYNDTDNF